jgi:hypothetical protein
MKRILLFALGIFASSQLFAQHEISVSASAGIGKTAPKYTNANTYFSTRYANSYSPTFALSGTYSYSIGDYSIESGFSFNDLKGNQTEGANVTVIENDQIRTVENDREITRKMRYLTVPLTLNYRTDKLRLGIGVYASYLVQTKQTITDYSEGEIMGSHSANNLTINFDYGFVGQVSFDISERTSILFTTNWGVKDIRNESAVVPNFYPYEYQALAHPLKNQQFMLGLKYRLYRS